MKSTQITNSTTILELAKLYSSSVYFQKLKLPLQYINFLCLSTAITGKQTHYYSQHYYWK